MSGFDEWWALMKHELQVGLHEPVKFFAERAARMAWHEARRRALREVAEEIKRYERETYDPATPQAMVCSRVRGKVLKLEQLETEQ